MGENKHRYQSDLGRIDRHEITDEEYAEIPELDDESFSSVPTSTKETALIKRGRPKSEAPKVPINIRLSPDVIERFKASGPGWQTRIDAALKDFIKEHPERGLTRSIAMDERKLSIGTHAGEAAVRDEVRIGPDDSPEWTDEMFDRRRPLRRRSPDPARAAGLTKKRPAPERA